MSSTYSSSLRIELIGSGDQAGAWGATTDSNLAYILDTAVAGYQAVTITSTNQALTYVNGPSSTANLNQAVYAMLEFTGASAATNIYIPPASKQYIVRNSSGYTITIYNSTVIGNTTAAGTGISVVNGDKIMVWSDSANVFDLQAQNLTGTLAIAKGGTGQTTQQLAINALTGAQTNNRVLRSDGTNATLSQVNVGTDVTGILLGANGGTGVANTSKTITLGGNLTTSGAFATTLTTSNTTTVTLPTTGTLTTLAGTETLTNKTLTTPVISSIVNTGTLTLPTTTDTLVGRATTDTLTNKTLSTGLVMDASAITSGTAQASTSGTSIDFTGIPSWVKRITVIFRGISTSGASNIQIQLGSTTFTTSGYTGACVIIGSALGTASVNSAGLIVVNGGAAAQFYSGNIMITNITGNNWVSSQTLGRDDGYTLLGGGQIGLSGVLDRVRITTVNGTDTFDLGTINILYE